MWSRNLKMWRSRPEWGCCATEKRFRAITWYVLQITDQFLNVITDSHYFTFVWINVCRKRNHEYFIQKMWACPATQRSKWRFPAIDRKKWHTVAQSAEALRYKPEGLGFDPDGVIGIFHWHYPSGRTFALELTHPLTELSTRNISWGVKAAGA